MLSYLQSCRRHLASVEESYGQHLVFAGRTGVTMIVGGGACIIHGLLPFLFQSTGSRTIETLHRRIRDRARYTARVSPLGHLWGVF